MTKEGLNVLEEFFLDDKKYFCLDGHKFCGEDFLVLPEIENRKVAQSYFSKIDVNSLSKDEMMAHIKNLRLAGFAYIAKKLLIESIQKYADSKYWEYLMPMYVRSCRDMGESKEVIEEMRQLLMLYPFLESVPLYTTLIAACCDSVHFQEAEEYAQKAYKLCGYKSNEMLTNAVGRLGFLTGNKHLEEELLGCVHNDVDC